MAFACEGRQTDDFGAKTFSKQIGSSRLFRSASRREQKPTEGNFNKKKWKKQVRISVQGDSKNGPE